MFKMIVLSAVLCALPMGDKTDKCPREFAPIQETKVYRVTRPFTIVVVNYPTLETIGLQDYGSPLLGLYTSDGSNSFIIVPFSNKKDKDGNYLPDFEVLAHELWHHVCGKWHDP